MPRNEENERYRFSISQSDATAFDVETTASAHTLIACDLAAANFDPAATFMLSVLQLGMACRPGDAATRTLHA